MMNSSKPSHFAPRFPWKHQAPRESNLLYQGFVGLCLDVAALRADLGIAIVDTANATITGGWYPLVNKQFAIENCHL
jgi:hypothetical protein